MKRTVVDRASIFFPSPGDPLGEVHVTQKWREAEAMCMLLLTAIARSEVSLNLLDLPAAARALREHVENYPAAPVAQVLPGASVVEAAVAAIRQTRSLLNAEEKQAA